MALNLHYSLLKEGANERFKVNEHNRIVSNPAYSRAQVMSSINHIMESALDIDSIPVSSVDTVEQFIDALNNSIHTSYANIDEAFETMKGSISNVKSNIEKRKDIPPKENTSASFKAYDPVVNRKLDLCGITISISNIAANENVTSPVVPDFDKLEETYDEVQRYIAANIAKNDQHMSLYGDITSSIGNDVYDYIVAKQEELGEEFNKTDSVFQRNVKDYAYQLPTNFGSLDPKDTVISTELFYTANKNVSEYKDILKDLDQLEENCEKCHTGLKSSIGSFAKMLNESIEAAGNDDPTVYSNVLKSMAMFNAEMSKILGIYMNAITFKMNRCYAIYGIGCDSDKVIDRCDQIINDGKDDDNDEIVLTLGAENECARMFYDSLESAYARLDEALMEYRFTNQMYSYINEADENNNNNNGNNEDKGIVKWIKNFINIVKNAFDKFVNAIKNMFDKNKGKWAEKRDKFAQVDLSKVKVKDYYDYDLKGIINTEYKGQVQNLSGIKKIRDNINSLVSSTGLSQEDIDKKADELKSDNDNIQKETEEFLLKQLPESTVTVADDASFTNKAIARYQHSYIPKDGEAQSIPEKTPADIITFIDQYHNGLTKSIEAQRNMFEQTANKLVNEFNSKLNEIERRDNLSNQQNQQTQQEKNSSTEPTKTGGNAGADNAQPAANNATQQQAQHNSADFEFSSAKELGIRSGKLNSFMEVEVTDNGGQAPGAINKSVNYTKYKAAAADGIRAVVKPLGEIIGARQQAAMLAYNQYMAIVDMVVPNNKK